MKKRPINAGNGFEDHGGYMEAKKSKLEEQFSLLQQNVKSSNLFEGISIFVNGRTNPTADELKRIMMNHGGIYHHYQRDFTKFVIASNLANVKIKSNITKNIIKPEWVVDCVKAGRILNYSNYLLHTNKSSNQPEINFSLKKPESKSSEENDKFEICLDTLNQKIQNPEEKCIQNNEKTGTAVDEDFLQEFLQNSRLHHISTLGSGFKYYITEQRKKHDGNFIERENLRSQLMLKETNYKHTNVIMHIDMDCFFVSVGLRKHPHLKGHPIAVTHSKGKKPNIDEDDFTSMSEIASCSYEARAKGIKNGMFVGQALKLCSELKTIPYDFEEYRRTAYILYDTVAKYTLDIEAVSCDEMYANLKDLLVDCKIDVMDFVSYLRKEIFNQTGCTCSVGIGSNRLQARLATKEAKPNGQFELLSQNLTDFMKNKKIVDLPGVGFSTSHTLETLNLHTCGQIQNSSLQYLQTHFGKKFGETLLNMSKGIDDRKLVYEHQRKSISVCINYGIRFNDDEEVNSFLKRICEELCKRLCEIGKKGKCITLKIMMRSIGASSESKKFMGHGEVDNASKSTQLLASTNDCFTIFKSVINLLSQLNIPAHDLRGIGIQVSKLDDDNMRGGKLLQMFQKISENQERNFKPNVQRVKSEPNIPTTYQYISKKMASPKKRKSNKILRKVSSNSNLSSVAEMFTAKKSSITSRKMIDPEVLKELPSDIVEEILNDYHAEEETNEFDNESSVHSPEQVQVSENNIFMKENWRVTIRSWIDDTDFDFSKTANLISDSLQLVHVKNLELLFIVMRFLHRKIEESHNEIWKSTYGNLYDKIQEEMQKVFNRKLFAPNF